MAGKFEILKGDTGQYRFNLKAGNGEIILSSQRYADKGGATGGIESVKTNAADDGNFERKEAKDGQHYFNLLAGNKQIIGTSEMYKQKGGMENGIESVKKNAPDAEVVDKSDG